MSVEYAAHRQKHAALASARQEYAMQSDTFEGMVNRRQEFTGLVLAQLLDYVSAAELEGILLRVQDYLTRRDESNG